MTLQLKKFDMKNISFKSDQNTTMELIQQQLS